MHDIASELAATLEVAGLGLVRPPAPSANLFTAPMPDADEGVPDRAVALVVMGGAEPQSYLGQRRAAYLAPSCQVRIRSEREDFDGGQRLAHSVFTALNQSTLMLYTVARAEESAPVYLGADGADRHRWVLSLLLGYFSGP